LNLVVGKTLCQHAVLPTAKFKLPAPRGAAA
jgi:hypothetical protein